MFCKNSCYKSVVAEDSTALNPNRNIVASLHHRVMQSRLCSGDAFFLYVGFCSSSSLEPTGSQKRETLVFAIANTALKVRIALHLSYATTGSMYASEFECKRYTCAIISKHTSLSLPQSMDFF